MALPGFIIDLERAEDASAIADLNAIQEKERQRELSINTATELNGLARRGQISTLEFFVEHGTGALVPATKTTIRTHFVQMDENGLASTYVLAQHLADKVIDFCIPRNEIADAMDVSISSRTTDAISGLKQDAVDLFVKSTKSGEGGELLLFALLENSLGIPQLLSKMSLKTSSNMHVHGTDGVHARLDDQDVLHLFWGESKLHKSPAAAIDDCFHSLAPFLDAKSEVARKRDIKLVHSYMALNHQELAVALLKYFERGNPKRNRVRLHGTALIAFDIAEYPDYAIKGISTNLEKRLEYWHDRIYQSVDQHELANVEIDVYCIPLPSVQQLRDEINAAFGRLS
ncbi:HamA C-terminal domain-containing protein [Frigoribacterium sp. 2355]